MKGIRKTEIAIYGKGGIGKSTMSANLSAAIARTGKKVLQIGCDPKHDSTRLLMHGEQITTVMDYLKDHDKNTGKLEEVMQQGVFGIGCVEAGGPRPGVGCAGRGIISAFEFLDIHHAKDPYDLVLYDVLGDVVCGGFAVPVRREYADVIFLVTSGEYMALYAANNILRGIRNYDQDTYRRVAGIIYNERKLPDEDGRVGRFARAVGLPICAKVPRSSAFAQAEEEKKTVMELDGWAKEKEIFLQLATRIGENLPLYEAKPLSDEELERVVLNSTEPAADTECCTACNTERNTEKNEKNDEQANATGSYETNNDEQANATGSDETNNDELANNPGSDETNNDEHASGSTPNETGTIEHTNASGSDEEYLPTLQTKRPPLYGCAFNGAATTAVHLTDARIIAHAPRACAFYTWQNISSPGRKNLFNRGILMPSAISPNFSCTDMGQTEAVFGGTEKLRGNVMEAMKQKPGAIVVISSCVSGIIGDDVKSLEELSTPELPVIPICVDGVIAGDYIEGIRISMRRIAESLIDPTVRPEGRWVNLINMTSFSNNSEVNYRIIRDLLQKLDIRINARFLGDTTASDMKQFLRAPLNILTEDSPDGRELQGWLEEKYHCTFAKSCVPVGFEETKRWLYEIAGFFDCTELVPEILREEEKKFQEQLERIRPSLEGKKLLITTINSSMDWLLETCDELGMEVVWIGVLNYLRLPVHVSKHDKFQNRATEYVDAQVISDMIREKMPDIVLTNYTSLAGEGDFVTDTLFMTQVAGFQSGIRVLERWAELLEKKTREKEAEREQKKGGWQNDKWLFEKYFG